MAKFWKGKIIEYNGLLKLEDFEKKNNEDNKYYFPDFIDYFATNLLPTIALWSHILWGVLSRYNAGYKGNGSKDIVESTTNGPVERYFGIVKRTFQPKLQTRSFFQRKWERTQGFRHQLADSILTCANKRETSRLLNIYKRNLHWLTGSQKTSADEKADFDDAGTQQASAVEESWMPKKDRKSKNKKGLFQSPPPRILHFDPRETKQEEAAKIHRPKEKLGFQNFRKTMWNDLAASCVSYDACRKRLENLWKFMPVDEKYIDTGDTNGFCNICKTETSDDEENMIRCDICHMWYHFQCVGHTQAMVDSITLYHCTGCTEKVSRSFVNYIHHRREDVILGGNKALERFFATWQEKNVKAKHVLETFDDRLLCKVLLTVECFVRRGIINDGAHCWLNSTLQVVCGTSIKYLLPQGLQKADDLVDNLLKLSTLPAKDGQPIPTKSCVSRIANRIAKPLSRNNGKLMGQEDVADAYTQMMTTMFSTEESLHVDDNFTATRIELKSCLRCKDVSGEIQREFVTFVDVVRCKSNQYVTLKDAIWNEFTGKYELNVKYHCKGCATDITCDRVLLTSFYLTVPNILVFGIRRRDPESQYANCSCIFPDRLLDLRHSVAGLESSKPLYYQLVGMIVRLGKEADRGHYLCHMMTKDNKVVTVDDNKVTIHSWKKVVEDIQTQRHVQILIYCRNSGELWKSYESSVDSWRVDPTNVFNIKECWIEEKVLTDKQISCADLQSICADSCLNDNVMNSFLQNIIHDIMSKPEGNPKRCYATTSFMMDRLLTGDTQAKVVNVHLLILSIRWLRR